MGMPRNPTPSCLLHAKNSKILPTGIKPVQEGPEPLRDDQPVGRPLPSLLRTAHATGGHIMIDAPHQDKGPHNANVWDFDAALKLVYCGPNLGKYDISYVQWSESDAHGWRLESGNEGVAFVLDLTERKRAQEEHARLRQLESDLAHLNRLSIMGELTTSLAHEILHPIATARNNARAGMRFLQISPPNLDGAREALGCIVRDADRAKDIVGRMRDHIKKAPPRRECFDLNGAINEVIGLARNAIIRNGVSVQARLADGC